MPRMLRLPFGPLPLALAAGSGLLLALAFPKPEIWPLALVGLAPLVLAGRDLKENHLALGFTAGLVHFGILIYWLFDLFEYFGRMPWYLAGPAYLTPVAYKALYWGLFLWGLNQAERCLKLRAGSIGWVLAGAALFTGLEYFKGFFWGGLPWAPLGSALASSLVMVQAADLVGVGGLTFVLASINLLVASSVVRLREVGLRSALRPAAVGLGLTVLLWGYGSIRLGQIEARMAGAAHRTVSVIQGNIDQTRKWDPLYTRETMSVYRTLSAEAAKEDPWLIVWPETAMPFAFGIDVGPTFWLKDITRSLDVTILFGAPARMKIDGETVHFNRANLVDSRGRLLGAYDKVRLVPFGEYVPLGRLLPFLGKLSQAAGHYVPGRALAPLSLDGEKIGVVICYESVYPSLVRQLVAKGSSLLAVLTNDAWFGRTSAPDQHWAEAVLRAVENRRAVIRSGNTGWSGFIQPTGRAEIKLDLYERGFQNGRVPEMTLTTVYTRWGDLIPLLSLGVAVGILGLALYRNRKRSRHGF